MTRRLLSYVLVPLLSVALAAQQAPQVASQATQAPAPMTAVTPAPQPPASVLQDGTPVKLRLLNKLDSQIAKNGNEIPFDVVNDVVVGGVTVLRRGSLATGVVTQAKGSQTMGRAGRLSFTINDIQLRNGDKVPVRAFNRTSGENRTGEMIYLMLNAPMAAAPFFLLIHGTNTVFPRGTEINAFVNGDLRLNLASFSPAPSADPKGDELETAVQIKSTPDGAEVHIDGAAAGRTPLNITLMAGRHEIVVKKAGYSDWSETLPVSGGTVHVDAVLQALTAN
jgi:hypothetical protein